MLFVTLHIATRYTSKKENTKLLSNECGVMYSPTHQTVILSFTLMYIVTNISILQTIYQEEQ